MRLKIPDSMQERIEVIASNPGARFSFEALSVHLLGNLVNHNRENVTVVIGNGQPWSISPYLLSPVRDVDPTRPTRARR